MDESGSALRGAMVSVLGVTLASTVTDERGQFTLNQLPAGDYLLRAHMLGFAASTGAMIRVGSSTPFQRVQLRRLDGAVATTARARRRSRRGRSSPPVSNCRAAAKHVERLVVIIRASARRRGVVDPSSEAKHPQGFRPRFSC